MAESDDGFLGRWSRRKVAVARGAPVPDVPPTAPTLPAAPAAGPARGAIAPGPAVAVASPAPSAAPNAAAPAPAPVPTLDDVQALTPHSDFSQFVARAVPPEVRNAAMKKLFADPHFNVMDRLDIYIDDYSQPDPLAPQTLRQMASAKFLKLVEDDPPVAASVPAPMPVPESRSAEPKPVPLPVESEDPEHHAHADLRLQPHPGRPGRSEDPGCPGPGAE